MTSLRDAARVTTGDDVGSMTASPYDCAASRRVRRHLVPVPQSVYLSGPAR
jgi:hypothetical protein